MLVNIILYFLLFFLGICLGSFINVLVSRIQKEEKVGSSKSHCDHCHQKLAIRDLVPIISFLWLRGKCRYCHQKISIEHLVVELVMGLLLVIGLYHIASPFYLAQLSDWLYLVYYIVVMVLLLLIFLYDAKYQYILDQFSYPLIILGLISAFIWSNQWPWTLLAALVGGFWFLAQYYLSRGQWVGAGDIFLGIAMGLLVGWPWIFMALGIAYILGAIVSIYLLAARKAQWQSKMAFGPFLVIGTWLVLLWGEQIWQKYWQLIINL